MAKKIYDIKPPKLAKKSETKKSERLTIRKSAVKHIEKKPVEQPIKKHKKSLWPWIWTLIIVLVVAGGTYLYFKLPKAEIIIWPKVDTLDFKQMITLDKSVTAIDTSKNVIPAYYFSADKTNSQDFPATGSASNDGKASGNIIVYNKTSSAVNLRSGTHFMSDSGKLFVAYQKIAVPAAKKVSGKTTPGSVQVQVQATESGEGYNVAPSNFSIPGLKGTSLYYSVYAASTDAMTGGYTGKVKKVTADDIQGAKDVLSNKTKEDSLSELKSEIGSDYIILDNAIVTKVTEASTQTKAGSIVDNFNYKVTASSSTIAFKKSDLDDFIRSYTSLQIPQEKTVLDIGQKINYSAGAVDISGGKVFLNLEISTGVYQSIDKDALAGSLTGKDANQINQTITDKLGDQVSKIKVDFWPFWVFSSPKDIQRVELLTKFD